MEASKEEVSECHCAENVHSRQRRDAICFRSADWSARHHSEEGAPPPTHSEETGSRLACNIVVSSPDAVAAGDAFFTVFCAFERRRPPFLLICLIIINLLPLILPLSPSSAIISVPGTAVLCPADDPRERTSGQACMQTHFHCFHPCFCFIPPPPPLSISLSLCSYYPECLGQLLPPSRPAVAACLAFLLQPYSVRQ
ncbi:hypothetical protein HPB48_011198 [Haemaphysalis longicornis]|uniref:Transmembrane protein n=1 Tax=Haemaphysalis longicornis TaxID=44386 RepID=A0A9J6GNF2_HAELO|nr:hypothetical protein HPB48_011198 [Haemaphysalis longicornis]